MTASKILNNKLRKFSERLWKEYGRSNKLPLTIIGAEYHKLKKVNHSGKPPKEIADKLEKELTKIAPIGQIGHKYPVGCCCEVRAANEIMLQKNIVRTKDIQFTLAKRPRTWETIRRCENCKQVFG